MQAAGKTITVTGGGNGIGRELVLGLLNRGARVAAIDINEAGLAETTRLAGDKADQLSTHVVNICDRASVEALPAAIIEGHGTVDGLINCAGIIQPFVHVNDLDYDAIERVMNVNFWGVINMTKTFLPHMLERPEAHLVNVSSMGGFMPFPGQSVYGASKAAVKLLTEGLHSELMDTNVSVTTVFPGAIATDISANSGLDAPRVSEATAGEKPKMKMTLPADAARMIIDGMERNAYRVMVGKDASLLDRMARLMPERSAGFIYKQMKARLAD
ncbi:MAG: SDR family NAD(P)-dependent oxidoreductase [Coriobacteriia bacterium]